MSPETVWNPSALEFPTAPRKILERISILPRREFSWSLLARVIFENQFLRYMTALLPFIIAMLIWRDMALPISQAPLPMFIAIGIVEMRVLRVPRAKRDAVTTEAEAARALDTLAFRGRGILAKIAAGRGLQTGALYLVVEQSELAKVPPLTVVSVQLDSGKSRLLPLTSAERDMIRQDLFDADFTERALHLANLRENEQMRSVAFEARGVSAHARLAAFLEQNPAPQKAQT